MTTDASPYWGTGEVAVFWYSFYDTYLSTLRKSMIHEFDIRGIENTHYDGEGDQALQINQIETAVAQGMEHMETILEEGDLVELVIANNDDMAVGAVEALQTAGYNTPEKTYIPVFGIDGTDMAKDLIASGAMTATVEQDTEGQARAVACIAENMLRGHDRFDGIDEEVKYNWYVSIRYIPYTGY